MRATTEALKLFRDELWKDQRVMRLTADDNRAIFEKYAPTTTTLRIEAAALSYLHARVKFASVPRVLSVASDHLDMEYIQGIRLFNLLIELQPVIAGGSRRAQRLRDLLVARAERAEREIQLLLATWRPPELGRPYPVQNKLRTVVRVLAEALEIRPEWRTIDAELAELESRWVPSARTPFRDASPKNVVLSAPDLWLGSFASESARSEYIANTIASRRKVGWISEPLYSIDFASCGELTTPEDDPVSLLFHETTFGTRPLAADALSWAQPADMARAALTFLVRYYRFGGRRACYKTLHKNASAVRYKYEHASFYFGRLGSIILELDRGVFEAFRHLIEFGEEVARKLPFHEPTTDIFAESGLAKPKRYYVDMYPA
jgi:hypothetical protein